MKSVVYCFTGTGNSLFVAKELQNNIESTAIIPMTKKVLQPENYDMVGFVYPVYFQGLPLAVHNFISELPLHNLKNTYIYAIATYGAMPGISLSQIDHLLKNKNGSLSYSENLKMFSNYVVMYNMSKKVEPITQQSSERLKPVIKDISKKHKKSIGKSNSILEWYYQKRAKGIRSMDKNYSIDNNCVNCGLCASICPVSNIEIKKNKPLFLNHCQQCMACVQFCPCKAINYKTKTQKRRRYHHPAISQNEIISFYSGN